MKKLAATLCLAAFATGAFGQGLVKMSNSAATLISAGGTATSISALGFYYALLTAPNGATDPHVFQFAGVYGTNTAAAGRFAGGLNTGIATSAGTWAPGEFRSYEIVGWSADNGTTFNPTWIQAGSLNGFRGTSGGFFGVSGIGSAQAGGTDPVTGLSYQAASLFGQPPLVNSGFNLVPVPEPTTMALAGLGAAALLIFRRRK